MKKYNLISGLIWILLSLLIGFESIKLGVGSFRNPDAGLFPLFTAILVGFFSILLLLETITKKDQDKETKIVVWSKETRWKDIILTFLALIVYAMMMEKAGYLLTTFVFILFLFKAIEPQTWSLSILGALITVLLSYIIFNVWLQCQFPEGIIFEWFKNFL